MTEEEKNFMLCEERYATLRVKVRDIYQECDFKSGTKKLNLQRIELLRSKMNIFNRRRFQSAIDVFEKENKEIDDFLNSVPDMLIPIADEMKELEDKLGERGSMLYGRDFQWWIRH